MLDRIRWRSLWERLAAPRDGEVVFEALRSAYAQPHRTYHDAKHIEECLGVFDAVRDGADDPDAVEAALWFHDAVYAPRGPDNEARSADWARESLAGIEGERLERIATLILATAHTDAPLLGDAALVVDVDLSILGRPATRFAEYEIDVRREYDWLDDAAWRAGRAAVLEAFVARDAIYTTPVLHDRFEARARANLAGALRRLRQAKTSGEAKT